MISIRSVVTAAGVVVALALAGSAAAAAAPVPASSAGAVSQAVASASGAQRIKALLPLSRLTPAQQRAIARAVDAAAPGVFARASGSPAAVAAVAGSTWADALGGVIDPTQYACAPGAVDAWVGQSLEGVDEITILVLFLIGAIELPSYDALFFGQPSATNAFGYGGAYTNELNRTMRDLRGFWDIQGQGIQLIPMHGAATFRDAGHLATVMTLVGWPSDVAAELAPVLQEIVLAEPALRGGDHPIFTFNAFAFTATGDPDPTVQGISDRIVMGDGILAALAGIGLSATAPRSVLAHEYGHHVQSTRSLISLPADSPEASRRAELMADAFAGYFMTHKKGQAANKFAVLNDQRVAFSIGDCTFDSPGHHGTPNQRMASMTWASDLAASTLPRSTILPTVTFGAKFDAQLPLILAPDAP